MKRVLFAQVILILVLTAGSINYYSGYRHYMPQGIHDWAQADRLSLAMNFVHNDFKFFKPATHFVLESKEGIVGTELPLPSYLAALLSMIFGYESIAIIFRLLNLFFASAALLIIYRIAYLTSGSLILSFIPPLFLLSSPVYVYYAFNFLSDPFSYSLLMAALLKLMHYFRQEKLSDGILSLVFATLATLIKYSCGIYWILIVSGFGFIALKDFSKKELSKYVPVLLFPIAFAAILGGYYFYIRFLNEKYNSHLFLTVAKPFEGDVSTIWSELMQIWNFQHLNSLSDVQWLSVACGILIIPFCFLKSNKLQRYFLLITIFSILAALIGFFVMGKQFLVHDYYSIVILYPALTLVITSVMVLLSKIRIRYTRYLVYIVTVFFGILWLLQANHRNQQRMTDHSQDFFAEDLAVVLNRVGAGEQEQVLILNRAIPNLGLVYADRKGIVEDLDSHLPDFEYFLLRMKKFSLKYFILDNEDYNKIYAVDSCFFHRMKMEFKSDSYNIYSFLGTTMNQMFGQLTSMDSNMLQVHYTSFEYPDSCVVPDSTTHSGKYAYHMREWMHEYVIEDVNKQIRSADSILVRFFIYSHYVLEKLQLTISQRGNEEEGASFQLDVNQSIPFEWNEISGTFPVQIKDTSQRINIFMWNPSAKEFLMDDLWIEFR